LICSNPDRKHDEDKHTMRRCILTRGFGTEAASAEFQVVFLAARAARRPAVSESPRRAREAPFLLRQDVRCDIPLLRRCLDALAGAAQTAVKPKTLCCIAGVYLPCRKTRYCICSRNSHWSA
jgi:hypothetical protein